MATAFGFDITSAAQGVGFRLSIPATLDRRQAFGDWEAELRSGSPYICVRGGTPDQAKALDTIAAAAHPVAEDFLDIVAVEERTPLLLAEPHDALVWRQGQHGLKVQFTASITFSAEPLLLRAVTTDKAGNVVPAPPYVPPPHHAAYRYFRYSQAAQDVFDAHRGASARQSGSVARGNAGRRKSCGELRAQNSGAGSLAFSSGGLGLHSPFATTQDLRAPSIRGAIASRPVITSGRWLLAVTSAY